MNRRKYVVLITAIMVTASLPIMISPTTTSAGFSAAREFQVTTTISFEIVEPEPAPRPEPVQPPEPARDTINWFVPDDLPEQEVVREQPEVTQEEAEAEAEVSIEREAEPQPVAEPEIEPVVPEVTEPSTEREGDESPVS